MSSLYLLLNVVTLSFPLLKSFDSRIAYAKKWKALAPGLLITATFFIIWDVIFTAYGVWGFNPQYLLGIHFFGLPLEEWLFFLVIPFACVFIYECVGYFIPDIQTPPFLPYLSRIIALLLIALSLLHADRMYTYWNFMFGGIFLGYISIRKPMWLGRFWVAYLLHLIPFFIVNGILTGSWIEEQVVWYNNEENLNIRLFTIPIEDSVYSLLLLLMNVAQFEWFKSRMTT